MICEAEPELICDFAETYHIYDYRALPLHYAATLALGLGSDSRVGRKLSSEKVDTNTLLLATIADRLATLIWFQSEDGRRHRNRPKSLVDALRGVEPDSSKPRGFRTKAELDAALARFEKR